MYIPGISTPLDIHGISMDIHGYPRDIDQDGIYMGYTWNIPCIYMKSGFQMCLPVYIRLQLIFCPEREGTYLYILRVLRLSTYYVQLLCSCLRPASPPAPCWPACTLLARSAFVAATRHTWSRTNKCIIMSAATGLAKSGLLVGSSRAICSTGSASKRLRARQLRCLGDKFALECCRQR